ncbi:hypothetical protein LWC34_36615 [Kibdelosporangium philippinense]|uniref:DUF6892 domain-containing protein n=1 Tax=Kibdelosporangium philippinense TaxID=211113 RepID=A0ABS8ZKH7_9PSEU|nr:hypothetical protein [Kibdelosporangium philippinense]MCE7008296.1 hypothetical protein [Kibdelosporangium philippinense]
MSLTDIEDVNVRLAIIDALMRAEVLPSFSKQEDEDRDDEYREDVADALLAIPVTAEQCAAVTDLYWEAGNDITEAIWTYWDGESDEFTVRSLNGIDKVLPSLEQLRIYMSRVQDLTPVAGCGGLRELALDGGTIRDLSPLSGLSELRILALNHALDIQHPDLLAPLAGLPLEWIAIDTLGKEPVLDLAPLLDITSLRNLSFRRTVGSDEVLAAFDNAKVIELLRDRGVAAEIG